MANAEMEPIRELAFGDISGSYAAVGSSTSNNTRLICFTNNTQGDVFFTRDHTGVIDEIFVAAGSFKLFDIQSNVNPNKEDRFVFRTGTQWYVKQISAPVSGSVYIEILY